MVSGTFHLVFLDPGLWVIENLEGKTKGERERNPKILLTKLWPDYPKVQSTDYHNHRTDWAQIRATHKLACSEALQI
jgi:hypothetical protein